MIAKSDLTSIISKYYLGGLNESVKWTIQDNHLTINFASPTREMIGKVEYDDIELEEFEKCAKLRDLIKDIEEIEET